MCGIAGWVDFAADLRSERDTAEAMTASMSLRGPDAGGLWLSQHAAIGHRRLAVIDPAGGVQPMVSGDTVLSYSGEVYNYRELRSELRAAGHHFETESDTEVVLRAYEQWGADMVDKFNGMYAFAIWDGAAEELVLVRDRMGVKPLYTYCSAPSPRRSSPTRWRSE
jgi:asparagine synthase (glutamine-hydrolysing)